MKLHPWEHALILDQLGRRSRATQFSPGKILTPAQRAFRNDRSRFKVAVCGRGAGKTFVCGEGLLGFSKDFTFANCAYVTGTRRMAKNIMWPIMLRQNREYSLGFTPNHSDLVMTHKNGGRVQLSGANNVVEIDKLRGQPWDRVNIDEAQMLGRTLKSLVLDVISPRLVDRNGELWLTGTPGPVLGGPFYEFWMRASQNEGWSLHEWTMADNPHILNGRDYAIIVEEEAKRRGVDLNDPSIQREFFGRWVRDVDALVLRLTTSNYFKEIPPLDNFVIGVDIGYDDADAIAVIGWPSVSPQPRAYLVEETVNRSANVTDLGERVADVFKRYNPHAIAVDTAGIGKKVFAELASDLWNLPVVPFDKTSKTARVLKLRAAIDRGEFLCQRHGYFDHDAALLQWEMDHEKGVRRLSDKSPDDKAFHSDIIDAAIGAFMEAQNHLAKPPAPPKTIEQEMREERREGRQRKAAKGGDGLFAPGESATDDLFGGGSSYDGLW